MLRHLVTNRLRPSLAAGALAAAACTLAPAPAGAHFVLKAPASWQTQDALGSPQKAPPCGDEAGGMITGEITSFAPGQTIDITIEETIFHPGHYRIALAVNDRSELPEPPVVTPADTPCGSVDIMDPPVFPVLADGVLAHTSKLDGPQTVQVTLPSDVTCDHCTLQIIEFMSNHGLNNPGGCFYHHCADISIQASVATGGAGGAGGDTSTGGATPGTGGSTPGTGGSMGGAGGSMGGAGGTGAGESGDCGCSVPGNEAPALGGLASALALAMLGLRRRPRAGDPGTGPRPGGGARRRERHR